MIGKFAANKKVWLLIVYFYLLVNIQGLIG